MEKKDFTHFTLYSSRSKRNGKYLISHFQTTFWMTYVTTHKQTYINVEKKKPNQPCERVWFCLKSKWKFISRKVNRLFSWIINRISTSQAKLPFTRVTDSMHFNCSQFRLTFGSEVNATFQEYRRFNRYATHRI